MGSGGHVFFFAPELLSLCALSFSLPIVLKKWWPIRWKIALLALRFLQSFG